MNAKNMARNLISFDKFFNQFIVLFLADRIYKAADSYQGSIQF